MSPMSIEYGVEQLTLAVRGLASSDRPLAERVQSVWDEHIQMLWSGVYLPHELNERFKAMWGRYTAPSDDPRSTVLRPMAADELTSAASEVVALALDTVATHARGETAAPVPL
jgi:hypothetical protein